MNKDKLKEIKVNQTFKTYKEICEYFNEPVKTGSTKHKQFLEWNSYININRINKEYIITEIYKEPKPLIDDIFIKIYMIKILTQNNETNLIINIDNLIYELNNIRNDNKLYDFYKYEGLPNIDNIFNKDIIIDNQEHKNIYTSLKSVLKDTIKQMKNERILYYIENISNNTYEVISISKEKLIKEIPIILYGYRKPRTPSLGEKLIEQWLWNHNINYIFEFKFIDKEYKKINELRFDFAIFKNTKLICLIEYDGLQHERPINKFGGFETYERIIYNDNIKNQYCKDKEYKLIRIKNINNLNENNWKLFKQLENLILPLLN